MDHQVVTWNLHQTCQDKIQIDASTKFARTQRQAIIHHAIHKPETRRGGELGLRNQDLFGSTPKIHKRFSVFHMVFQISNFSQMLVSLKQFSSILCSLYALPLSLSTQHLSTQHALFLIYLFLALSSSLYYCVPSRISNCLYINCISSLDELQLLEQM